MFYLPEREKIHSMYCLQMKLILRKQVNMIVPHFGIDVILVSTPKPRTRRERINWHEVLSWLKDVEFTCNKDSYASRKDIIHGGIPNAYIYFILFSYFIGN